MAQSPLHTKFITSTLYKGRTQGASLLFPLLATESLTTCPSPLAPADKAQRNVDAGLQSRLLRRTSSGSAKECEDDFVGLGGIDAPHAPSRGDSRKVWEERHRQQITDQMYHSIMQPAVAPPQLVHPCPRW